MSTLEELKHQARQAQQQADEQSQSSALSRQKKWAQLGPVMQRLRGHFKELAETLNYLNQDMRVDFKINDELTLANLKAQRFQIYSPHPHNEDAEFIFQFDNQGQQPHYCTRAAGPLAKQLEKALQQGGIKYFWRPIEDDKCCRFQIEPLVRTKYHFIADVDDERIMLNIIHYDGLWTGRHKFSRQQLNDDLLDALTKHAMRKQDTFNQLVGHVMPDEMKTALREKLQREAAMRAQQAQLMAAPEPIKKKTLFGRLLKRKP